MSSTARLIRVLLVTTCIGVAVTQPQVPTASVLPSFVFAKDASLGNLLTASLHDNVTLVCSYPDKEWFVRIVRWHPNKGAIDEKSKMRKFIHVAVDRNLDGNFSAIMNKFPEFGNRLSTEFDKQSGAIKLNINNYQLEDAGDFGCYASKGSNKTQIVNLTIKNYEFVTYADMPGFQKVIFNISQGQNLLVTFNCSIMSIYGYQVAPEDVWFDTCMIFDSTGKKLEKAICDEKRINGTLVERRNFTEGGRYGEFWPQTFVRTKVSTNITINQAFYNRSIGCFIHKSKGTLAFDFQTIAQAGVDLHFDPANFRCSAHHISAKVGSTADFWCVVRRPMHRQFRVFWEVFDANANEPSKAVYECEKNTSCVNFTALTVFNAFEKEDTNLYVKEIMAQAQMKIDVTSVRYKLRLVAMYMNIKRFESDFFTVLIDPTDGERREIGNGSGWLHPSFFLGCFMALATALARSL